MTSAPSFAIALSALETLRSISSGRVLDWLLLLANLAIAATLVVIRVKFRRDIAVGTIIVALAVFFVARGVPYLIAIVASPASFPWLTTNAKLIAALAALCVAVTLPFLVPRVGALLASARSSRLNEQRFVAASHNSSESVFILDSVRNAQGTIDDFRFAFVNENGARMFSSTPQALRGTLLCAKYPVIREEGFFSLFERTALTGTTLEDECQLQDAMIDASWIRYRAEKLGDGLVLSMRDISKRKTAEQAAATALTFSRSLIAKSPFAVIALDVGGCITQINRAAERMLGYSSDELVGQASALVLHDPAELAARAETLSSSLGETVRPDMMVLTANPRRGVTDEAEWSYIRKDGSRLWVQVTVTALTTEEKQLTGWLCFAYDITDRKRTQDQIAHMAQHDALTGLPTRTLLHDRLQMALERSQRSTSVMALLMIDLDNFKRVNDLHGHSAGDELLVAVAKRLEHTVRKSDTVARMGGDEFVVLLEDLKSPAHAERVAQKLIDALSVPVHAGGESLPMSASIGLCVYPDGGHDSETLLKNADVAMYFAKSEGRSVYRVFSTEIHPQRRAGVRSRPRWSPRSCAMSSKSHTSRRSRWRVAASPVSKRCFAGTAGHSESCSRVSSSRSRRRLAPFCRSVNGCCEPLAARRAPSDDSWADRSRSRSTSRHGSFSRRAFRRSCTTRWAPAACRPSRWSWRSRRTSS